MRTPRSYASGAVGRALLFVLALGAPGCGPDEGLDPEPLEESQAEDGLYRETPDPRPGSPTGHGPRREVSWSSIGWRPTLYLPWRNGERRRMRSLHEDTRHNLDYAQGGKHPRIWRRWGREDVWVYSSHPGRVRILSSRTGRPCKLQVHWQTLGGGTVSTEYNHLDRVVVRDGDWIGAQEPLAIMAKTETQAECNGRAAEQHLHQGLYHDGRPVHRRDSVWSGLRTHWSHAGALDRFYTCPRDRDFYLQAPDGRRLLCGEDDIPNEACATGALCERPGEEVIDTGFRLPFARCAAGYGEKLRLADRVSLTECAERCADIPRCKYFSHPGSGFGPCDWQQTRIGENTCPLSADPDTHLFRRRGRHYIGQALCRTASLRSLGSQPDLDACEAACRRDGACSWVAWGIARRAGECWAQAMRADACPGDAWAPGDLEIWDLTTP